MKNTTSVDSSNIPHLAALDDLRGIAALMVLFAHITHNLTRGVGRIQADWLYPANPIVAAIAEGHAGVSLFLVLSGFVFAYGASGHQLNYWQFIRNRALRIMPMYLLMLVVGASAFPAAFSLDAFLSSLLLFSNTQAALNGGGFTILLWTIAVEFTFYLIFPFIHRFKEQYGLRYIVGLIALVIFIRVLCIANGANPRDISYYTIVGRLDQFLIGMLLAYRFRSRPMSLPFPTILLALTLLFVGAALYGFNQTGGWLVVTPLKAFWHTFEAAMFAALIVVYLNARPFLWKRCTAVMAAIGTVSFSIYLLHMPILLALQSTGLYVRATDDPYLDAFLTGLIVVPLVIGVATATHRMIEKPFMSMRGRYIVRDDRNTAN